MLISTGFEESVSIVSDNSRLEIPQSIFKGYKTDRG